MPHPAPAITRPDLIGARTDGMTVTDLARDAEVSRATVLRAERRTGILLPRSTGKPAPIRQIESMVEAMAPGEAIPFLLQVLRDTVGDPDSGLFTDLFLTNRERAIVLYLYHRPGQVVGKQQIMDYLYAADDDPPCEKIIDIFVHKIRKKIAGTRFRVTTIWGQGYRLDEEVENDA